MTPILTHVAITSQNIDKTIQFYQEWCGMKVVHERSSEERPTQKVVWLVSPGYEGKFVIVVIPGRTKPKVPSKDDIEHFGFAVPSVAAVRDIAQRAKDAGILFWDYVEDPYPVGHNCGIKDPDGNLVEFSFGQPIGFE